MHKSVFALVIKLNDDITRFGTAFCVGRSGTFLTSSYICENVTKMYIQNSSIYEEVQIQNDYKMCNVCVLKLVNMAIRIPPIMLSQQKPKIGTSITSVSFDSNALTFIHNAGVVKSTEYKRTGAFQSMLTSIPASIGSMRGSPILNVAGQLIGILTWTLDANNSGGVDSNVIQHLLEEKMLGHLGVVTGNDECVTKVIVPESGFEEGDIIQYVKNAQVGPFCYSSQYVSMFCEPFKEILVTYERNGEKQQMKVLINDQHTLKI